MYRLIVMALAAVILALWMPTGKAETETVTLRIIATSDLHGKMVPWNYAVNAASPSGSMAQLATAIARYRTPATLLVDAGDTVQDNAAEIFIGSEDVHPMVQALNALDYDVWVAGNHEFNFGMDVTEKVMADLEAKVLVGNVYDPEGKPIADGFVILNAAGIRVAVIGMVTPNIKRWEIKNLMGYTVTDPREEARRIIDAIRGQYDVLVGVCHMSVGNEYDVSGSGVEDLLNACPEFDVMVAAHEHRLIVSEEINGVLVVENKSMAQTMSVIDLTMEKTGDGWRVAHRHAESVAVGDFEADPAMSALLTPYDKMARADAQIVVGRLEGVPLAPESEIPGIPTAQIRDTALIDLINAAQLHYSGADVSSAALCVPDANLYPGDIRKCDTALVYKYDNTLYKIRMTGAQLKEFMEWTVEYFNTFRPGDLTVSFNPAWHDYNYDMFEGIRYEVNIACEPGSRIQNLTWPDGTPVRDDDVFDIAVNNYRANSQLLTPGFLYEADDMPILLERDVHGEIGGIRELIRDYIVNVRGGVITPECNDNWRLVGCEWDEDLHRTVVRMVADGRLSVPASADGSAGNARAITAEDLRAVSEEAAPESESAR